MLSVTLTLHEHDAERDFLFSRANSSFTRGREVPCMLCSPLLLCVFVYVSGPVRHTRLHNRLKDTGCRFALYKFLSGFHVSSESVYLKALSFYISSGSGFDYTAVLVT